MLLTETHIIHKANPTYKEIDELSFLSKNLYNTGLYHIRQHYKQTQKFLNYNSLQKILQNQKQKDYIALPAKISQKVLKQLHNEYISFFALLKIPELAPDARPPHYKDKIKGRNMLVYTNQAIYKEPLKNNIIHLSQTNIKIKTKVKHIQEVRIIKRVNCYKIEVVYKQEPVSKNLNSNNFAAIDLGVSNLATLTFSTPKQPIIINGNPVKSINQFYNKKKGTLQSHLKGKRKTSNKIEQLTFNRNNKINDYLHKASRYIINQLVSNDIGTLIIGQNLYWKQEVSIGKRNNQNFIFIPHSKFISMLKYKAMLVGINVITNEESYTSKCSFLDLESIEHHENHLGRRVKRGLFKSSSGKKINADVNGSYNIMRKVVPEAFSKGIEGFVVSPIKVRTLL